MKKIILFLIIFSTLTVAQSNEVKSFQELKAQLSTMIIDDQPSYSIFPDGKLVKKSNGLGILYSLLLPGMGELYAENYNSGKYFTIADGVLWGFLIGFNVHGSNQEDNYKAQATTFAGTNVEGKEDFFFANLGNYMSVDDYNNGKYLDRNFEEIYDTKTHYWKWNTHQARRDYRSTWTSSETAYNNTKFVVWGLLLNRVVSAINAVRLVSSYNKKLEKDKVSWNISVGLKKYRVTLPTSMTLDFRTSF